MTAPHRMATAGQDTPGSLHGSGEAATLADALAAPGHPGITVGDWTLRWAGDQWSVGQWKKRSDRMRWANTSWYNMLPQALRELLSRSVEGDVTEISEIAERVERRFAEIEHVAARAVRTNGRDA